MQSLITTIGLEIEFSNIQKALARGVARARGWNLVEDGSTRNYQFSLGGLAIDVPEITCPNCKTVRKVNTHRASLRCTKCDQDLISLLPWERHMFGGEFVSPLIDTDSHPWVADITEILGFLERHGEGVDARTSIHVHVNCSGLPLFAMQQLIRIGCYLESAMYRLACAEAGIHRGRLAYDYGYCRPITGVGPPVTATTIGNNKRQIFSVDSLLEAGDWNEFKQALGRYDRWGGGKYHEARYVWLNPISFFVRGSMEFRIFNSTLQPRYLEAWVELCKKITQASFGKDTDLPQHPLGDKSLELADVIELLGITSEHVIYALEDLWNIGSYQRPPNGLQWGHVGQRVNWSDVQGYLKPPICEEEEITGFGSPLQEVSLLRGVLSSSALNATSEQREGRRRRWRLPGTPVNDEIRAEGMAVTRNVAVVQEIPREEF